MRQPQAAHEVCKTWVTKRWACCERLRAPVQRLAIAHPIWGMLTDAPPPIDRLTELADTRGWKVIILRLAQRDPEPLFEAQDGWVFNAFNREFRLYLWFAPDFRWRKLRFRWGYVTVRPPWWEPEAWLNFCVCMRSRIKSIDVTVREARWVLRNAARMARRWKTECGA